MKKYEHLTNYTKEHLEEFADNLWKRWYEYESPNYKVSEYGEWFNQWAVYDITLDYLGEISGIYDVFEADEACYVAEDEFCDTYYEACNMLREYIDKEYEIPFDQDNEITEW